MFAGWKVAGIVGLAGLVALGVQEIRVRGLATDLATKAGQLAQAHRDVNDAAGLNAEMSAANVTLLIQAHDRAEAQARLERRSLDLQARIKLAMREAQNVPLPPQPPGCTAVDPRLADFARRL